MIITRAIAEKVRDTVAAGLVKGVGEPVAGQMCVEAAVCFALGLPHGDDPGCVSPSLRRLKIALNDKAWSSNQARAEGLKRLALAQLGSLGVLDDAEFRSRVIDMTIRKAVPVGLRAAARVNPTHAEALEAAAVRCEQEGTREACQSARTAAAATAAAYDAAYAAYAAYAASAAAYAAAYAAAAYAAYDASAAAYDAADAAYAAAADAADAAYDASAAAYDAAADAAYAADAADDASAAAYDAAADAAYAAAAYDADAADDASAAAYDAADDADDADDAARTRDRVLGEYAEWVVEILIDMQAPGCQWLPLLEARHA